MKTLLKKIGMTIALPVVIFIVFSIGNSGNFASGRTLYVVLQQTVGTAIVAYGFAFANMIGITDFSIGARLILSEIVGGILSARFGLAGLVLGALITSVLCGLISAVLFRIAKIPSFILAFGLALIFEVGRSIAAQMNGGTVILTQSNAVLGKTPWNFIILALACALFSVIYYRTRFSYLVQAIGSNEVICKSSDIDTLHVKCLTYIVGAVFIGIGAIVLLSYSSAIGSQLGMATMSQLFKPMMAYLIAKTLSRNCPIPIGIIIGTFSLNLLFTGIIAIGLLDAFQNVALGFMMLVVMALSVNLPQMKAKTEKRKKVATNVA